MIYLATPYSHPDSEVMHRRYEYIRDYIARHQPAENEPIYSPIVHWHEAAKHNEMPTDAAFWWRHNSQMIDLASKVLVLKLEGLKESKGVRQEINYAMETNKNVEYHDPSQI